MNSGRSGSTSTTPCAVTTHLPVARVLHQLHCVLRLLIVRPVTASRGATTRRPDCTCSTAPMPCIRTSHLAARLLVSRSHCLSPCVRPLRLAARLLVVRIAPALLCLCRASGRTVSTLDFSSVGRTGSRLVPGHSVVRHDYLSRGRNGYISPTLRVWVPRHIVRLVVDYFAMRRLVIDYFDYAAHPGASARRASCRATRRRLLHLRRAIRCLGSSRGSSRGPSHGSS
jgi:hypothetical protein